MKNITGIIITAILSLFLSLSAKAEGLVRVSVLTCYPGSEVYELDGHTALRVQGENYDVALSWGVFDFNAPNFVYRFVKGETDYMVAEISTSLFLAEYARQGRKVVEQEVPLDSLQTEYLLRLLGHSLRPENRVYRYNYVKDNCATRPLEIIAAAKGWNESYAMPDGSGAFSYNNPPKKFDVDYVSPDRTFREVMTRYHRNYPWYQFGIDLALGSGIDYEISPREQAFSPMLLMQMLPYESKVIIDGADTGSAADATPWPLTPMAVFMLVLAIALVVCAYSLARRSIVKWFVSLFYGTIGIAGCVLTFLIFVSVHEATSPNYLYFFFNPLSLVPAIFVWVKRCGKLVIWCQIVNFALIIIGILAWPLTGQAMNSAIIPLLAADISLTATYLYVKRLRRLPISN